jgi:hypothetical protein
VFLFGKVPSSDGKSWQSCCAVVTGLQASLLAVPKDVIFNDATGEIAALEAAAAEDPKNKAELLRYLHVRLGSHWREMYQRNVLGEQAMFCTMY